MTEFRTRIRKLKPGSVMSDGRVVDYLGRWQEHGAFIPTDISPARKQAMGDAGWCLTPSRDWPSMLPDQGVTHITRLRR